MLEYELLILSKVVGASVSIVKMKCHRVKLCGAKTTRSTEMRSFRHLHGRSVMITRVPEFYVRNGGRTSGSLRTWKWSAELCRSRNDQLIPTSLILRAFLGHFLRSTARNNRDVPPFFKDLSKEGLYHEDKWANYNVDKPS